MCYKIDNIFINFTKPAIPKDPPRDFARQEERGRFWEYRLLEGFFFTIGKWPPLPPPLHEVFFCAGRLTLEPDLRLRFFKKGK